MVGLSVEALGRVPKAVIKDERSRGEKGLRLL